MRKCIILFLAIVTFFINQNLIRAEPNAEGNSFINFEDPIFHFEKAKLLKDKGDIKNAIFELQWACPSRKPHRPCPT